MDFDKKVIVVSGASGGIGFAVSTFLLERGARRIEGGARTWRTGRCGRSNEWGQSRPMPRRDAGRETGGSV